MCLYFQNKHIKISQNTNQCFILLTEPNAFRLGVFNSFFKHLPDTNWQIMSTAIKSSHFDHVFNTMILYKSGCDCNMEKKTEYLQKIGYKSLALPRWFADKSLRENFILRKVYIINMCKKKKKTNPNDTVIIRVASVLHFVEGGVITFYRRKDFLTTYNVTWWRFSTFRSNLETNHPHLNLRCFLLNSLNAHLS